MHKYTRGAIGKPLAFKMACSVICFLWLSAIPGQATATISFEDVSQQSGIIRTVQTAGSAWGDFNGDGWPDLWVSNHDLNEPSLYLNMKNGSFTDVINTVIIGKDRADFHGGAWADFDNDGDQDLFLISGGASGRGYSPNFLFVNQDGKLKNEAEKWGVDYPFGRGRTPLWFDADHDGKLDLLTMNRTRSKSKSPSAIFLQTEKGFVSSNSKFGFNPIGKRSKLEKIDDLVSNAMHFRFRKGSGIIKSAEVFAQITDYTGDGVVDLFAYMNPMRVYSTKNTPFDEITNAIDFPNLGAIQDAALEDFNGDGRVDMFLARSFLTADVVQVSPLKILGKVKGSSAKKPNEVEFRSTGDVTFAIHMPWRDPTDPQKDVPPVWPGLMEPIPADGKPFTLSPDDPSVQQGAPIPGRSVAVNYDPATQVWRMRFSFPVINFVVTSDEPIDQIKTIGFKILKGGLSDSLLLNGKKGLAADPGAGVSAQSTISGSVAAGDFDNDMDIDLYLVCREPVQNIANILYENDGNGHFTVIPDAGGAAGSKDGRGEGVSMCDYDRDGFLDLFVTNGIGNPPFSIGPHQLFKNTGSGNHWLEIDLKGTVSNRDALGAIVELEAGGKKQLRVQNGGIHSFSQNFKRIHFGLGPNTVADKLTIRWPSGVEQEVKAIAADQILEISETDETR